MYIHTVTPHPLTKPLLCMCAWGNELGPSDTGIRLNNLQNEKLKSLQSRRYKLMLAHALLCMFSCTYSVHAQLHVQGRKARWNNFEQYFYAHINAEIA